jgi:hypothetical protein
VLPAQGLIPLASVVSSRGTDAAVLLQPWTNPIASRKGVLGRGNYVPTPALRGESEFIFLIPGLVENEAKVSHS